MLLQIDMRVLISTGKPFGLATPRALIRSSLIRSLAFKQDSLRGATYPIR